MSRVNKSSVKKKKSKGSSSSSGADDNNDNCSCSFLNTVLVVILMITMGSFYVFEISHTLRKDQEVSGGGGGPGHDKQLSRQYEEVLSRAISLAKKYKNITGQEPSIPFPSLRGLTDKARSGGFGAAGAGISSVAHLSASGGIIAAKNSGSLESILYGSSTSAASAASSSSSSSISGGGSYRSSGKVDIVVGMAQDTDPKNLVVFCNSLRKVAPNAEAMIFVNTPIPERHQEIAKVAGVKLIEFDLASMPSAIRNYHPSTLRWSLIYKLFEDANVRAKYGRVLMADVRDTFFQSNPFDILPPDQSAFYAFNGVETMTIGACGWNGPWVRDCFGDSVFAQVSDKRIICSGVSIGTMDAVFSYLTTMDDVVMGKKQTEIGRLAKFPQCERNGVDQGAHNVLVHKNLIPNLKIWSQSDGMVANLQARKAQIRGKEVLNERGSKVAVVHQYDRFPDLQSLLFKEYVYWINTADAAAEWAAEESCKNFEYKQDVDLFKGLCDLKMQGGVTGPSSCCSHCLKAAGCKGFTYVSGICFMKKCTDSSKQKHMTGAVSAYVK